MKVQWILLSLLKLFYKASFSVKHVDIDYTCGIRFSMSLDLCLTLAEFENWTWQAWLCFCADRHLRMEMYIIFDCCLVFRLLQR